MTDGNANKERAMMGIETIGLYSQVTEKQEEDMKTLLVDLLCDLMHACDMEEACGFDDCLRIAKDHYQVEVNERTP